MQSEQRQDKQHTDPVAPREPAWRRTLVAFRHMLNIGNDHFLARHDLDT